MDNKLVNWVTGYLDEWRDNRDNNYLSDWKEYERLWRGEWASEDRQRDSERSRITSPALQQAIENHTAEIESAVYGQGEHLFDIEDNMQDEDHSDVEYIQNYMKEKFKKNKIRKAVGDVTLLASIYGTGIGEVVVKKTKTLRPATQEQPEQGTVAIGTEEVEGISVTLLPISPQNFLIDPTATTVEDALGVAVEQFVSSHVIAQRMQEGIYKDVKIDGSTTMEDDLEASWIDEAFNQDKVHLIRYFGLVPQSLLDSEGEEEVVDLLDEAVNSDNELTKEFGNLVEAIIVIGNGVLLKAEANPYMMKDRPIIAYQDDSVPNRFWGRGVAEKGYNMQKAIDAQLRSHMDSLALTTVPMMAMDATRLPRGSKFEVRPGKSILTNGNPAEILMPFSFGQTSPQNIETAGKFEAMLLQATGTIDSAGMQSNPAGAGEMSVTLASIIKKNKRTLVNFQDSFLIPFIEKAAWRYMQFDPENMPVKDYNFIPVSSLGMLAKEVEQLQVINLLKTLGPNSPMTPILMEAVITNSSLPNRQAMIKQIQQAMTPNPEKEQKDAQMAEAHMQLEMQTAQAQIAEITSKAQKQQAEAQKTQVETQLLPEEAKTRQIAALSTNLSAGDADDKEFARRAKVAELSLKEKDINLKELDIRQKTEIVKMQMAGKEAEDKSFKDTLNG